MGLLLLIVLILLLCGGLPTWNYSRNWGYGPSGILGLLLVILLVMLLLNAIPWGFGVGGPVVRCVEPPRCSFTTQQDGSSFWRRADLNCWT
jgi:Protein of unknown function (DUF3309)